MKKMIDNPINDQTKTIEPGETISKGGDPGFSIAVMGFTIIMFILMFLFLFGKI